MFHGGVIITTRKLEYDADAGADVVKSLMQAQHKHIMKGLRKGAFDDKIDAYLGNHPELLPRGHKGKASAKIDMSGKQVDLSGEQDDVVDDTIPLDAKDLPTPEPMNQASPPAPPRPPPIPAAVKRAAPAAAPTAIPSAKSGTTIPTMHPVNRPPRRFPRPGTASRTRIQPAPPPVDSPRPDGPRIRASGEVLVSSPPIVVKSSGTQAPPAKAPPARTVRDSSDSIFNQNHITEKSLDEVILAYLSEDADD